MTGNYRLVAMPGSGATMSFDLTVSQALTGTLIPGTPVNLNLAVPGQFAYYSFTAKAGETFGLNLGSIATTPAGVKATSPANIHSWIDVVAPGGGIIATAHGTGATRQITLSGRPAGTYTIYIWPTQAVTTSMSIEMP